ncbi:MAG: hypothetical protein WCW53_15565 [Syntrophales bacterium]
MTTSKEQKISKNSFASKGLYDESFGKEQERKVLLGFLKRLQLGYYEAIAGERPDFTLNFSFDGQAASIGCEITFYYADKGSRGSAQQRFVKQWKKFAKSLRAKLDEEGQENKYLYGAIHFKNSDFTIMDRFDNDVFISQIVLAVRNRKNKQNIRRFERDVFSLLAEYVDHIYLMDTTPELGVLWWPSHLQSGEVDDPTQSLIEILEEKNKVGRTYDWGSVSEKWLLIYSEASGIADMAVLPSDFSNDQLPKTCFDRVYIWDRFFGSIHEIYPNFFEVFSVQAKVLHRRLYSRIVRPFILSPNGNKDV